MKRIMSLFCVAMFMLVIPALNVITLMTTTPNNDNIVIEQQTTGNVIAIGKREKAHGRG